MSERILLGTACHICGSSMMSSPDSIPAVCTFDFTSWDRLPWDSYHLLQLLRAQSVIFSSACKRSDFYDAVLRAKVQIASLLNDT